MIYTTAVLASGAAAAVWLAVELRRAAGQPDRPGDATGAVARIAGEVLLGLGIWSFVAAGVAHSDGVDLGSVWVVPVLVLAAVAALGALQPARAVRQLRWGAVLLVALMALLTAVTFFADRAEFDRTTFGPLVQSIVFVAVPALVTSAFFGMAAAPPRGATRTGRQPAAGRGSYG